MSVDKVAVAVRGTVVAANSNEAAAREPTAKAKFMLRGRTWVVLRVRTERQS